MTEPNPLDAVKSCGTETQTDEEWERRKQTSDLLAPLLERERRALIALFDSLIEDDGALAD